MSVCACVCVCVCVCARAHVRVTPVHYAIRTQVIISCEPYDTAVDIWSFGCTLAELMSGTPLFPGSSSPDQLWRIMRCCGALADRHAAYLKFYPRLAALAETPAPGRTLAERVPVRRGARRQQG
mgnify:CR=1 FL=1